MIGAIPFPDISPEIFSISLGPMTFSLRWYALAYIAGILVGWFVAVRALKTARLWRNDTPPLSRAALDDLVTWIILGIIVGGRLGYVLVYQPAYYLAHPVEIPMIWQGGMSFHGGFAGVVVAAFMFGRKNAVPLLSLADLLALATPVGLFFGRIANFINAELWGRPTQAPWGVIFPGDAAQACATATAPCVRHPSQLYEAGLEGLLLGAILLALVWIFRALKRPGTVAGVFFAGYGVSRFLVEFFRQPDAQFITPENPMGAVVAGLSMGQLLSLPMILAGLYLVVRARPE